MESYTRHLREVHPRQFLMKSYPNSLGAETGLEPATFGLWGRRTTTALPRNMKSTRITMGAKRPTVLGLSAHHSSLTVSESG